MEVQRSEAVFLVGASGAGKNHLLYTLAGLERPEEGTVEFEGSASTPEFASTGAHPKTQMGFVFQSYFYLPELTGAGECDAAGNDWRQSSRKRAEESLRSVGLGERLPTFAGGTFGGEQAARWLSPAALVNDPAIVFADEPTVISIPRRATRSWICFCPWHGSERKRCWW